MGQPSYSVSVAGVVLDSQGRVLIIQRRDNGHWEPPGGILELEEPIKDGVRREVFEETGVRVEPEALTGVYKNMPRGIVSLVFRCRAVGGTARPTEEAKEVCWVSQEEIPSLVNEAFAIRLTDSIGYTGIPAVREHDGVKVL